MSQTTQKQKLILPRTLKGFRDFMPEMMIPRENLIAIARRVYQSYGFSPIDTPALECSEILLGKGGDETDKQMFRFLDPGGRDVAMRFDLTVPLARFAAQHIGKLGTPFRRYHIATVWRGEKPQRGRYREFMQCDFDTIGTKSIASDIETTLVIHDLLRAIGFERFTIHVNNRKVLSGLLERIGLVEQSTAVLRALDKLTKIGREKVAVEMVSVAGATSEQADQVLKLAELSGDNAQILADLEPLVEGSETGQQGLGELSELLAACEAVGLPQERLRLDVSIARGLDYYTGTIFETFLDDLPGIGSICSGGRYDNLAELYTKQQLPGIGASLGLDRLLAAMEELNMLSSVSTTADVFVPYFDSTRLHDYLKLAASLRAVGMGAEVYPEAKKLGQQLKYASSRGFRVALIAGSTELSAGECQVKDMQSGETQTVPLSKVVETVQSLLKTGR